jgi:UDPglucose--hexose-1-phosphate uridylyltransferase
MSKSEIRKDYFKNEYVIVASNRAERPHIVTLDPGTPSTCHFCPKNFHDEIITYQDNNYHGDWEVISVINKFAALSLDNPKAYGQCEVIIETRNHGMDINDFSIDHIVRVFNSYIDRFNELRNVDDIKHVIVFKNEGGKAGNSQPHTHSQVYAMKTLPPKTESEARDYNKYRLEHMTCPYCDAILKETDGPRVIWEDENVFVLAPWASTSPYGAWLLPKRHVRFLSDLTRVEKESLAIGLKLLLNKLDDFGIAYNYFIENAVNEEDYHMHIKLAPRPNVWGGLELGTGIIINPISPEFAAKIYRENLKVKNKTDF